MTNLTGTEKQIAYAESIMAEFTEKHNDKVSKMNSRKSAKIESNESTETIDRMLKKAVDAGELLFAVKEASRIIDHKNQILNLKYQIFNFYFKN